MLTDIFNFCVLIIINEISLIVIIDEILKQNFLIVVIPKIIYSCALK